MKMRRLVAALCLVASASIAEAQVVQRGGGAGGADTVGTTVTFNDANDTATLPLSGQRCAIVSIATGTLVGTLAASASLDGGTTYTSGGSAIVAAMQDPVSGVVATSLALTNPNAATARGLVIPAGATHVKVELSDFTSGSADVTLRAVTGCAAAVTYGTDGTNLRAPVVTSSAPDSDAYGQGVRIIGGGVGSSLTDNSAFTGGTTTVTGTGYLYATSSPAITDGRAGTPRMDGNRVPYTHLVDSAGDSATDADNDAIRVTQITVPTVGGQSATSTTTAYTNCTSQAALRMTSATTTLLIDAPGASTRQRLCAIHIQFDTEASGNTVKFVRGDAGGTNCGTSQAELVTGGLLWSKSFVMGTGVNTILDAGADNKQLCATLAGTSNATIFVRYSSY